MSAPEAPDDGPGAVPGERPSTTWVGRASTRPADSWPTAEQPAVRGYHPDAPTTSAYPPGYSPGGYPPPARVGYPPQPSIVYVEVPRRRRGLLFVLGVLAACVAGGAVIAMIASAGLRNSLGFGGSPEQTPSPEVSTSPPPPPPPGVGDPVRDGTFEFIVNEVSCGHATVGSGIFTRPAQGQFCIVEISVSNVGNVAALLLDSAQYVHTSDGTRRGSDSLAGVIANEGISVWINLVNPGQSAGGKLVFDIPADATLATVELHDSAFSEGVIVTL